MRTVYLDPEATTADELVKLNQRLDRYENYVKRIVHSIRDVFSDRWGWYLVGYIMGSA